MNIIQESIQVKTPSGDMGTMILRPKAGGPYPGLLLYSEIFQLTGPILRSAAIMAGHGFVVAVPEIYHRHLPAGTVLAYDDAGRDEGNRLKTVTPMDSYDQGARALIQVLQKHPQCSGKLGSVGFCLGGHLSFRAALQPEILASACWYATDIHSGSLGTTQPCDTFARMGEIKGELLMIWGRQDPHIPAEGRIKIHQELVRRNLLFTWHEFNAAHAFMRDEGERYDPELALICYRLALDLFNRCLK